MHLIQKINPAKPDQSSLPASMKSAGLAEVRSKFAQSAKQSRYYDLKRWRNLYALPCSVGHIWYLFAKHAWILVWPVIQRPAWWKLCMICKKLYDRWFNMNQMCFGRFGSSYLPNLLLIGSMMFERFWKWFFTLCRFGSCESNGKLTSLAEFVSLESMNQMHPQTCNYLVMF